MQNNKSLQISVFLANIRNGIWLFGIPSWLFGITDRSFASLADGYLSALDLMQLFTASLFFLSWLYLKPEPIFSTTIEPANSYQPYSNPYLKEGEICPAQTRMIELQKIHMISQEYILPYSYLCQIYHLLNLKHLETIHSFSLNNLKVLGVTHSQPTAIGGTLTFQTILKSPFNLLRIWRQPIVEVNLILLTPLTVELNIPVYDGKRIIVIFNVQPLSRTEHKFLVDIYSDLEWPRPLLQIILHFASCLTLFEDLPYLRKLAARIDRLFNSNTVSHHETMWLYKRYVELYSSVLQPSEPIAAIESPDNVGEIA